MLRLTRSVLVLPALLWVSANPQAAQYAGTPKVVQFIPFSPPRPIEFATVLYDKTSVRPNEPFSAGTDWLDHLTVLLRNRTPKVVTTARLKILFPETGTGQPGHAYSGLDIMLGPLPAHIQRSINQKAENAGDPPLHISPNEVIRFRLADVHDKLQKAYRQQDASFAPTSISVSPSDFFFEDGTRWQPNHYMEPDLEHPGHYVLIDKVHFEQYVASQQ